LVGAPLAETSDLFTLKSTLNTNEILAHIDSEIARLQQAKTLLTGEPARRTPGRPFPKPAQKASSVKKRTMSAEGRARIAAAQRARWARAKKAA
jgi:hypothetical protein